MKKCILRFLFKGSQHVLDVVMVESEAKSILKEWISSGCVKIFHGYSKDEDKNWAVNGSEVGGIVTVDLEDQLKRLREMEAAARQGTPSSPSSWTSVPASSLSHRGGFGGESSSN